jgi:hypothetical protein
MALGDKNEHRSIHACGASSNFERQPDARGANSGIVEDISITTLDDFVAENNLQIGLIKADVEGFEQNLLRGARKTIAEQKPVLRICIYHNVSDFLDIKPLIESWNLGYKFRILKPADGSVFNEAALLAEVS